MENNTSTPQQFGKEKKDKSLIFDKHINKLIVLILLILIIISILIISIIDSEMREEMFYLFGAVLAGGMAYFIRTKKKSDELPP